jgi:broad specificity phosphatase PhoE
MISFSHSFLQSLYVMRHGHSEANAKKLIVSSLEQGAKAYGLTEQGRIQVTHQVETWRQENSFETVGEIYCSPFVRACDTATIASRILQWPIVKKVPALRERFFGDLDQQDDTGYAKIWAQDELDPAHTQWHVESACQVRDRVLSFLTILAADFHGQPTALVTHGDTASIILTTLRQGDLRHHRRFGALSTAQIQQVLPTDNAR